MLGGNPFSGFSHQSPQRDQEMRDYYTPERICQVLAEAEELGVTGFIGRTDEHICGVLGRHRDQGGRIQWIAQTAPEMDTPADAIKMAVAHGARACYLHGGMVDIILAQERMDEIPELLAMIRGAGLPAGLAGHYPAIHRHANEHFDFDFHMCSYYNPNERTDKGVHLQGGTEVFREEDRDEMMETIAGLSRPVIHYKVLAAGRTDPGEAFAFAVEHMRENDAVCVGVCPQDQPDMLEQDVGLFRTAWRSRGQ